MRSPARTILSGTLTVLAMLLLGVAPSDATVVHHKIGSFTGFDAPGGPLGVLLTSDAIDQSNGDVYVTESGAFGGQNIVDKFNEAGEYAGVQLTGPKIAGQETFSFGFFPGVAVDNSTGSNKGDVYVADSGHHAVDRFSAAGAFLCEITGKTPASKEEEEAECHGAAGSLTPAGSIEPAGIAVDSAGKVYVADDAHAVVDEFSEAGEYVGQIKDPHISNEIGTIALDATGTLYLTNLNVLGGNNVPAVVKFDAAGTFVSVLDNHGPFGVGVDPSTGNVYVHEAEPEPLHEEIAEYDSSGALLDVTPTPGAPALGLAVNGATGELYEAGLGSGSVSIYSGDVAIPTVTVHPATNVTETTATLNGHLDPDAVHGGGEITGCEFEWGETTAYGHLASCTPGAPFAGASDVTAPISGLRRGVTYHFRVKATNANGTSESGDATLTAADQPAIDRQSSSVNGIGAVLAAQINPFDFDTTCQLQYVDDAGFKASGYATATTLPCAPQDVGSGLGDVSASVTLTGLKVATTYHYRFLATNQSGLTGGADRTFQTFGVHAAAFELLDKVGTPFTEAGGHPYELRTGFAVNWTENVGGAPFKNNHEHPEELPTGNIRTVITDLPPGLIGNPSATAKCTRSEVIRFLCSGAAQVGLLAAHEAASGEFVDGIYNLVPPKGVTAEFGANIEQHLTVYIDARLRPNGDYALTAESQDNSAITGVTDVLIHMWGVPADPSHDGQRCPQLNETAEGGFVCPEPHDAGVAETPLLFNPTSCGGPLTTVLSVDSYQAIGLFDEHSIEMPPITGCSQLGFSPSLQATPTSSAADSPTGLHVDLHIPQQPAIEDPASRREADLKDTVVTLPQGLTINPAAAGGLEACSSQQIGLTSAVGVSPATFSEAPAGCPEASKVGTVEVDTPLLSEEDEEGRVVEEAGRPVPHVLHGAVYIASPYDNPFGSLFAIYIAVEDPRTGVVIKLAGHVDPDPQTGQLTTTFTDSPQLPFEDFKLDFFSGPRATLATPESCGSYAASTSLTPWSGGASASPEVPAFGISTGCVSGFAPAFTAGTLSPQAGAYSPLTLTFQRGDSDQELSGLTVSLPPGLLAKVAGVQKCSDAELAAAAAKSGAEEQANPSCPAGSLLGTVQAGAGAGESPFFTSGKAYLTGPYKGGPYGLAVVEPALAGPFDLGNVIVRSALHIDPADGHVTAISDPFPTILKGVPLRLRRVTVTLDRPQFSFNPTSCDPMSFTGDLTSTGGLSAPLSQRFQVGGCQGLPFKPRFSASTSAHTSRANGASLVVKLTQSPGQADIRKVSLQLPAALPARLTTLNKACTEAQFNADPSGCPQASNVGTARAVTPILNVPLAGPAYLVSHGSAAFPDLEYVLQGEGVKIILDGKTDIKKGITYSHFETVPDAPISSFETTLPEGPHSILGAFKSLCTAAKTVLVTKTVSRRVHGRLVHVRKRVKKTVTESLLAPTTITAQNGAVVTQNTKIAVTGCSAAKKTASRSTRRKQSKK
jgi:hypothetical protein